MAGRGLLIALEGGDGAGKTTQTARLAMAIHAEQAREPGGTPLGEGVRRLLLKPGLGSIDDRAELLLLLAARAQHVAAVIRPHLESGRTVVVDRFNGSTIAYQGYGRGLPLDRLRDQCDLATGGLWPDLTILLDLAPDESRRRRKGSPDRIEAEPAAFHERVRAGFLELAATDPGWIVVDGSASTGAVSSRVAEAVSSRLGIGATR